ncbi:MAG: hypothetical protein ACREJC_20210, partial [Tepidisphaeraceae bacterium]
PELTGRILGRKLVGGTLAVFVALGAFRVATQFPGRDLPMDDWLNRHGADTPGYPCAAAEFVARNIRPTDGRLINEFTWGGYLAWRLGDRFQVLMDGRTQLYARDFWQDLCLGDQITARDRLSTVRADAAILPLEKSRLSGALRELKWKEVYRDDRAVVLVPSGSALAGAAD